MFCVGAYVTTDNVHEKTYLIAMYKLPYRVNEPEFFSFEIFR